jgi:hypothetical protein
MSIKLSAEAKVKLILLSNATCHYLPRRSARAPFKGAAQTTTTALDVSPLSKGTAAITVVWRVVELGSYVVAVCGISRPAPGASVESS